MSDNSYLFEYFRALRKLCDSAAQFLWNPAAKEGCLQLAEELRWMIERREAKDVSARYTMCFCREMLADFDPYNAAYFLSGESSLDDSVVQHAWLAYHALRTVELGNMPKGAAHAALTVCANMGVACDKALNMLEESENKAAPPARSSVLSSPVQLLLAKMKPEDRRAMLYLVR